MLNKELAAKEGVVFPPSLALLATAAALWGSLLVGL